MTSRDYFCCCLFVVFGGGVRLLLNCEKTLISISTSILR